jgi:type IV secretory pathway TrbD component
VGFTLIWLTFPVGVLIALRVFHGADGMVDRVTGFGALAAILCFVTQAWGDMGLQCWTGTLLLASFLGAAGAMSGTMSRAEVAG